MPAIALVCGRGVREDCAKEVRFQQSVQGQYSGRAQLPAPAPRMIISTTSGSPATHQMLRMAAVIRVRPLSRRMVWLPQPRAGAWRAP